MKHSPRLNARHVARTIALLATATLLSCKVSVDDAPQKPVGEQENARPPAIAQRSGSLVLAANGAFSLTCRAQAPSEGRFVTYQWYVGTEQDKTALDGEDASTLTPAPLAEPGILQYWCEVTEHLFDNGDGGTKTARTTVPFTVAYTGLPTVYVDTDCATDAITRDAYTQGTLRIAHTDGTEFAYTFSKEKEGIKGRGNSSWTLPKKGYNIKFDKKQAVLGFPKAKKWCLIANYSDKTLLRNKFASVLGNTVLDAGWNPAFTPVDLVLNGEYAGCYLLGEKITLTEGRVGVPDIADVAEKLAAGKEGKVDDANGDGNKTLADGGFILEIDGRHDAAFWFDTGRGVPVTLKDPDEVPADVQAHVQSVVQAAEDALYSEHFAEKIVDGTANADWWQNFFDIDSVIDWYLVNELAKNVDCGTDFITSVYLCFDPVDGKLHMGPNWDFDIGFGNANFTHVASSSLCTEPTGWYVRNVLWISRMFEDPSFTQRLKARWDEARAHIHDAIHSNGAFGGAAGQGIQALADGLTVSATLNFARWPILGQYVWPNVPGYEERTTYQSEVDYLVGWCNSRFDWLDAAFSGL